MTLPLRLDPSALSAFCRRWAVQELAFFGSVLREDFGPASDVDVLVSFKPGARPSLLDHVEMQHQLAELLGRRVDLVTRRAVEQSRNMVRRDAILSSARVVHVEG